MMRSVKDVVDSYLCHGCGACEYYCPANVIRMTNYPDVGLRPRITDQSRCVDCAKCLDVCSGITLNHVIKDPVAYGEKHDQNSWGPVMGIFEGWSASDDERYRGSSGGVGTAIGRHALEQGLANAVLHVIGNNRDPFSSQAILCAEPASMVSGAGSRYSPVSLCSALGMVDRIDGKVLIIGKPCEIAAIDMLRKRSPDLDQKIALTVSIFCGGTPSSNATRMLCEKLGAQPQDVEEVRYRGHGWPGNFSVKVTDSEQRLELSYQQAWDEVLTRHVSFRCSICPDGTGEFADISIGDPWYKDRSADPAGASLIVVRTALGGEFLQSMIRSNAIHSSRLEIRHLYDSQVGLHRRKQHVFIKIFWLKLFFMHHPKFGNWRLLRKYLQLDLNRILKTIYTTGKWIFYLKRQQLKSKLLKKRSADVNP